MEGAGSLYGDFILHISPDKFFVESLTATAAVLVIDRISGEVSLQTKTGQIPVVASRKPIAGLLGVISLLSGPYLVVVTRKVRMGVLLGSEVWRVAETEIISYARPEHHLTPRDRQEVHRDAAAGNPPHMIFELGVAASLGSL